MSGNSLSAGLGTSISGALTQTSMANSQYGRPYQNQGLAAQQQAVYNSALQAQAQIIPQPQWVIAGKSFTITQFADELFGDTPARTMFLLKYSGERKC